MKIIACKRILVLRLRRLNKKAILGYFVAFLTVFNVIFGLGYYGHFISTGNWFEVCCW